jgi:hypothetical protein
VSPSWRDRVHIALSPSGAAFVRFRRGARCAIVDKRLVPCASDSVHCPWDQTTAALAAGLQEWAGFKADATVILSNHFVRYALVPWSDQINADDELKEFARHCFLKVYGGSAAAWVLRISRDGSGAPMVASAVDDALIETIVRAFDASPLRLLSIQPYLMAAYNQWFQRLRGKTARLVLTEPGRLCLALFRREHWHSVRSVHLGDHLAASSRPTLEAELRPILERESYLAPLPQEDETVPVFIAGHPATHPAAPAQAHFQYLDVPACPGFSPETDRDYVMAMSG